MDTLKIEIPEGHTAEFDKSTGKVTFAPKPKKVTERIKTFEDVINELGIDPTKIYPSGAELQPDEIAYIQLKLVAKALNEGWEPDWTDGNQPKYRPYFDMDDASAVGRFSFDVCVNVYSYSAVGSRLCYQSREIARYAGKQFEDLYRQFMTL